MIKEAKIEMFSTTKRAKYINSLKKRKQCFLNPKNLTNRTREVKIVEYGKLKKSCWGELKRP